MSYRHTQTGWLTLMVCGGLLSIFVIVAARASVAPARPFLLFGNVPLLAVVMFLFGSLTVTVDDAAIALRFGPGVIRKRIKLDNVTACQPVKNRWWGAGHPAHSRRLALQCLRSGCGRVEAEKRPGLPHRHG